MCSSVIIHKALEEGIDLYFNGFNNKTFMINFSHLEINQLGFEIKENLSDQTINPVEYHRICNIVTIH